MNSHCIELEESKRVEICLNGGSNDFDNCYFVCSNRSKSVNCNIRSVYDALEQQNFRAFENYLSKCILAHF